MGRLGQAFVDDAAPRPPRRRPPDRGRIDAARVWEDVPVDDARVRADRRGARRAARHRAAAVPARASTIRTTARRFLAPASEPAPRSVSADRHARGGRSAAGGGRAARAHRDPRRLRRRRHHRPRSSCGARIELLGGDVAHFVPDRLKRRLRPAAGDRSSGCTPRARALIVSVDCGIRATEAAAQARELGRRPDHHRPSRAGGRRCRRRWRSSIRSAPDCAYPDKMLAGVGVALKLVQALLPASGRGPELLPHFVKVAAIGTLADVVPLVGENRVIAHCGLSGLSRGPHGAGLEALLEECGLLGAELDSFHVGFMLAPRLNAAGRMGSADLALDLLLMRGRDARRASARARPGAAAVARRTRAGRSRKPRSWPRRGGSIDGDPEIGAQNLLVVAGDGWHRGVIGIVASKLVDAYHKPAIVLSIEDGIAHGSGRSIPAFDLLGALESCATCSCGSAGTAGGRRHARGRARAGAAAAADRLRQRAAWSRGPRAAAAHRRAARPARDLRRRHRGAAPPRSVRRGQSQAGVPGVARRSHGRRRGV